MLKFTTYAYISVYQYSIDIVHQYSNNIGQAYPSTFVVIQSLKMDQYPFRPWDDKLGTNKALVYYTKCNRPDIAFVNTLL
jgi:hypothetical protein